MGLIYFILFIVMIVGLIWPAKVLSFVKVSNGWRRVIAVVGWFVICTLLSPLDGVINKHNNDIAQEEARLSGEIAAVRDTPLPLYDRLKSDSAGLANGTWDPKNADNATILGVQYSFLKMIAEKKAYEDDAPFDSACTSLIDKNAKVAANMIKKLQPEYRKRYIEIIRHPLWESNIEVSVRNNYKVITFIGGVFANNKNKQDFQNNIYEIVSLLGFTRVEYKWYKYDDEYTYYTIE